MPPTDPVVESDESIIERTVKQFQVDPTWRGLGGEVIHALTEGEYVVIRKPVPAVTEAEAKVYTFRQWMEESLGEVDPDVVVSDDTLNRLRIHLHGDWHIATVYGPPTDVFTGWLDTYPRQLQTEIFRRIIFSINSWCRMATDRYTGETVKS